jgi:predicted Zn finger-like uncharacterized protein
MTMVTRCPSCATLFRVTPQQLQARGGQVRCGRCMRVFDGFNALATLPDRTPPQPAPAPAAPTAKQPDAGALAPPSPVQVGGGPESDAQTEIAAAADRAPDAPELAASAQAPPPPPPAPAPVEAAQAPPLPQGFEFEPITPPAPSPEAAAMPPPRPAMPAYGTTAPPPAASAISADASFLEQAHAKPRRRSRWWAAGSVLALLALAGQAAYHYRGDLASSYPVLRPALASLCDALGCSVPLPQRPKLINIEASDLQLVDPARPGLIQLTATLRNHGDRDLGYPALDLVLTNTREHTLARRIFLPEEYLERLEDARRGFAARAETTIRLVLDTGDLGAAGFRLDLLPAPAR